jgi:hypothetical protein
VGHGGRGGGRCRDAPGAGEASKEKEEEAALAAQRKEGAGGQRGLSFDFALLWLLGLRSRALSLDLRVVPIFLK